MRWLICGSRGLTSWTWMFDRLLELEKHYGNIPEVVISGAAPGVDSLGARYAYERGADVEAYGARWRTDGKPAAGPIRNQRMLDEGRPDVVVAFTNMPLERSRGTADMVRRSERAGLPVHVFEEPF